jgi:hypothetical protein
MANHDGRGRSQRGLGLRCADTKAIAFPPKPGPVTFPARDKPAYAVFLELLEHVDEFAPIDFRTGRAHRAFEVIHEGFILPRQGRERLQDGACNRVRVIQHINLFVYGHEVIVAGRRAPSQQNAHVMRINYFLR